MIVSHINKLKFSVNPRYFDENYIELKTIMGKSICNIHYENNILSIHTINKNTAEITFNGQFDYLKISRKDNIIPSYKIEIFCQNCGEISYPFSGNLPKILRIETDFHVTKD